MDILIKAFESANKKFLHIEKDLILSDVSERCLCGSFKDFIKEEISKTIYKSYYVDIEYNRNKGKVKTFIDDDFKIVTINCDLIVHSRSENMKQDNLLALEMKKENRPNAGKKSDKYRLIALTKPIDDGVYSADGRAFPEHVCGYILGIYYELDIKTRSLNVEYYHKGLLYKEYKLTF